MNPPIIILVQTQLAVNIGMCARAMLNCGLTQLRLVTPRDGWPNADAISPASEARDIIANAEVFQSVAEATADCHQVFAASARVRHLNTPSITPTEAALTIQEHSQKTSTYQPAILFGPEASGLDNESISFADRLVNYPMNPDYTSLNLAQAVLLFSWEWWKLQITSPTEAEELVVEPQWTPVPKEELQQFMLRLEQELDKTSFFANPEQKASILQKLRILFTRTNPTTQELRSLHGIISALSK